MELNRRQFLKTSAITGGGVMISAVLPGCASFGRKGMVDNETYQANAWLRINSDNSIYFVLDRVEMGQGTYTGLSTLLAEELEVDPATMTVEFAGVDSLYRNPIYGLQLTGGSTSLVSHWENLRKMGATTRMMMQQAAGDVWKISAKECVAREAFIYHPTNGQKLSYGELASIVATMSVPSDVPLKEKTDFKLIGRYKKRLDAEVKSTGKAVYGIDIDLPNMLYAVVTRSPSFHGELVSSDLSAAKQAKGVVDVFPIQSGIAVVAKNYWQARKAQNLVIAEWSNTSKISSDDVFALYKKSADEDSGSSIRDIGDYDSVAEKAAHVLKVEYKLPYLAHATMEPQNCVVNANSKGMQVWAPTQSPDMARVAAARNTRYSVDDIEINVTFIGGGFGRRIMQDYVEECAEIADIMQKPVKLIWSREDDTQHDWYRPATYHKLSAAINEQGSPQGWSHQIVGPKVFDYLVRNAAPAQYSFMPKMLYGFLAASGKMGEGIIAPTDISSTEGADNYPYSIPNQDVRFTYVDADIPIGYWRSVGYSHNGFVVESFMDELAHQAKQDPYAFRYQLLAEHPRAQKLLKDVAEKADWGNTTNGMVQGIAIHQSFGTWVAQVADIEVHGKIFKVKKITCGVDCGIAVNPDMIKSQMEGGIIFGLTAALYGKISIKEGAVQQSNFHDYQLLRMSETPEIDVIIMQNDYEPTGVGEPGVPPVAPAIANALFAATGQRLRELPLKLT